jgi:hypothetical protein
VAVETFGVDADHMAAFEPQIEVSSDGPITSARLTLIINASAAKINGLMTAAGITPSDIASDTTTVAYANARRLVTDRARIDMQAAAYGSVSVATEVAQYDERAAEEIRQWIAMPATLGSDEVGDAVSPGVLTSTGQLGLSTTDTHRRRRRRYDRARDRTSEVDDLGGWGRTQG